MKGRPLTDDEIADTLLQLGGPRAAVGGIARSPAGGGGDGRACVHEDRLWDLARGALSPEQAATILDHTLECLDCSLALRVAHETFAASGIPSEASGVARAGSRFWSLLSGSLLSPAPALAYLVLLVLSFPVYRILSPPSATAPGPGSAAIARPPATSQAPGIEAPGTAATPMTPGGATMSGAPAGSTIAPGLRGLRVLRLTGDISLRGGGAAPAPALVSLREGEALELKLIPDTADLPKKRDAVLVVRVLDGAAVVSAAMRRVSDLEADQSLSLLLDRDALQPGKPYVVELALAAGPGIAPGPPLLRQSFLWKRD